MSKTGISQISKSDDLDSEECWDCYTDYVTIRSTLSFTFFFKCHLIFSWIVLVCPSFLKSQHIYISCQTVLCLVCPCVCVCVFAVVMVLFCPVHCSIFNSVCSFSPTFASTLSSCDNWKKKKIQIFQLFSGGRKAKVPEQELLIYTDHIFF